MCGHLGQQVPQPAVLPDLTVELACCVMVWLCCVQTPLFWFVVGAVLSGVTAVGMQCCVQSICVVVHACQLLAYSCFLGP